MRIGSLFTGYSGLDMAVEAAFGASTAWVSDIKPAACKLLDHRYPDVPNLGDITKIDWSAVEPVDIITGGSPCQDLSAAGRRAGMTAGTRSNLWVNMREAIATLRPEWVVWENVRGAYSARADSDLGWTSGLLDGRAPDQHPKEEDTALRALGRVLGDLADLGFDAEWRGLRAADVGAPHGRFRVFVVAHARPPTADADGTRLEGYGEFRHPRGQGEASTHSSGADPALWGRFSPAIERWEQVVGTPAPSPVDSAGRLSPHLTEWMMGLPTGWITDVPGLTRSDQLSLAGDGVVPQQAYAAIMSCLEGLAISDNTS